MKEKLFKCEEASIDIAYKVFTKALRMLNTEIEITPNGLASISSAAYTAQKIYAGKFVINLIIKKSNVRGSIIVRYNTCKLWWKN